MITVHITKLWETDGILTEEIEDFVDGCTEISVKHNPKFSIFHKETFALDCFRYTYTKDEWFLTLEEANKNVQERAEKRIVQLQGQIEHVKYLQKKASDFLTLSQAQKEAVQENLSQEIINMQDQLELFNRVQEEVSNVCPICETGTLIDHVQINSELSIPMQFSICTHCGSEQASQEQMKLNKKTAQENKSPKDEDCS